MGSGPFQWTSAYGALLKKPKKSHQPCSAKFENKNLPTKVQHTTEPPVPTIYMELLASLSHEFHIRQARQLLWFATIIGKKNRC